MEKHFEEEHGIEEETEWRIRVLKRTARVCAAQAKRLEQEKHSARRQDPLADRKALEGALQAIDDVLEWRFVDPLGCVVLDSDVLAQRITVAELRTLRACTANALTQLDGSEPGSE